MRCPHPRAAHNPTDGACALNGCGCPGFLAEYQPTEGDVVGPRRVSVDVPDGYMVTISLVPYVEPADA